MTARKPKKLLPSQERLKELFEYEEGLLICKQAMGSRRKPGDAIGCINKITGYTYVKVEGVRYLLHRLIWKWHHGTDPQQIDHLNAQKSDNRIENLEDVTPRVNSQRAQTRCKGSSLPTGVRRDRRMKSRPYQAAIRINGKRQTLGYHRTAEDAHTAYLSALGRL